MSRIEAGRDILLTKYQFDVTIVRIRKTIKRILPTKLTNWNRGIHARGENVAIHLLEDDYPWMSPNIWNEIVNYYRPLDSPIVVEFGTGASTIHHLTEMMKLTRAQYVGIENNPSWFWLVVASLLNTALNLGVDSDLTIHHRGQMDKSQKSVDIELKFNQTRFLLKLRTSISEYIAALDMLCDVVIVDGSARKQCVQMILNKDCLRPGGLLMLMEAGRGSDKWWEGKLYGDSDYSQEVEKLLSLGGEFLDGNGFDNWPNCKRKSPRPTSYYCPLEALKLIRPPEKVGR